MSRADIMAGRAYVSLYTKQDQFTRGLQKAKSDLNAFGSQMLSLGARMVAMSVAIATPIAFASKTFSDFDDAMRTAGAVTQATAVELASMTAVAKELGRTTSFTAVQVASLMTELGRAGFKPDQVNAMTGAVLNLARATGTDATLASGIMAATIRQFNLEATDAARVADVLTLAANSTFNTVEGLGESLKYAGPVAKELGMSLEDTVAILGSLGNVGIHGSEAGTALRRLGVISAATGEKLKSIFNISNVDAAGNLKPLVQIMSEIGAAVEELPVAERVEKMNEAFGLLGITSASVLAGTGEDTAALAESLRNAGGAAEKAAVAMDAGLGGSIRIILSAVEGLQIALGEALAGSIKGVTDSITGMIGRATEWVGRNQGVIVSLATITTAAAAAGLAIMTIGLAAKASAVAVGMMVTAFGFAKSAVLAVIAVTKLWAIVSFTVGEAIYLLSSGTALLSAGSAIASGAAGILSTAWASAGAVVSAVWAVITAPIFPFIAAAAAAIAVATALGAAAAALALYGLDFSEAWRAATGTLLELMDVANRVGGILMEALAGGDYDIAFGVMLAGIKLATASAIDGMVELWGMFWNGLWSAAKNFFNNYLALTGKVVTAVSQAISNPMKAAQTIKTAIADVLNGNIPIGIDTVELRRSAKDEIDRLEQELAARKAKRESEQQAKAAAANPGGAPAGAPGAIGDGTPVGGADAAQMDGEEVATESAAAFERETEALQQQIIALRQGAEAAERFRLSKQGLTDAEIDQVMALREEEQALQKQQEMARQAVKMLQDYADADYKKNGLTPEQIAQKEKAAIEAERQRGVIDDQTAKEANAQADMRRLEREHQERLKKFVGDDGATADGKMLKAGGASAATFSAASLVAMGGGAGQSPQVKALNETKKSIDMAAKMAQKKADEQLAALKSLGLHHA